MRLSEAGLARAGPVPVKLHFGGPLEAVTIMKSDQMAGPAGKSRTLLRGMNENSIRTPPGGSASHALTRPGPAGPAALTAVLIVVGSVLLGVAAGSVWAAAAPRVLYQVYTLSPPTAYATNPETSAFIAADGWYCFIALTGGAIIGLIGYVFGVRRYGPVPMAGIIIGSVAAAFITAWVGQQLSGGPGFDQLLATSRPGTLLHAPIQLGARGALAFWPFAAAGVAGGIELVGVLKARHRVPPEGMPMPGMETFGTTTYLARPGSGRTQPGRPENGHGPVMGHQDAPEVPGGAEAPDGGPGWLAP